MMSDQMPRHILTTTKSITVVGASNNPDRASYQVFAVNPGLSGGKIGDVPVYSGLKDIGQPIDMVDISEI